MSNKMNSDFETREYEINKHLMTGPKGNSEFCFPETLNVPRGKAKGNIEVEGKKITVSLGASH